MALLIAAAVMLAAGGATATRAALNVQSEYYIAHFYLNHLQVHLLENGRDVCGGHNDLNGDEKVTGELLQYLGYSAEGDSETLGSVEPGKAYKEVVAARNGQDIAEYVRLTVRKYWMETKDGKPVEKSVRLAPSLIHLQFRTEKGEVKAYNDSAWQINRDETTTESATYYYSTELAAGADTEPLFNELVIDGSVAELGEVKETSEDGKTIYTYEYKYDGYAFFVEADVQAIQTHNANDAIHSQWGVYNVEAADGRLSVSSN